MVNWIFYNSRRIAFLNRLWKTNNVVINECLFRVNLSKQVNDLLCSYNLLSCGGLSKSDIIRDVQNSFANMTCVKSVVISVSYFCLSCFYVLCQR